MQAWKDICKDVSRCASADRSPVQSMVDEEAGDGNLYDAGTDGDGDDDAKNLYDNNVDVGDDGKAGNALYDNSRNTGSVNSLYDNNVDGNLDDQQIEFGTSSSAIYDNNANESNDHEHAPLVSETNFSIIAMPLQIRPGGSRKVHISGADIGQRVIVADYGEGVLAFFGMHAKDGKPRCGVVLDEPKGLNNGTAGVIALLLIYFLLITYIPYAYDVTCVALTWTRATSTFSARTSTACWWIPAACCFRPRRPAPSF